MGLAPLEGAAVKASSIAILSIAALCSSAPPARGEEAGNRPTVVIVIGAAGDEEYTKQFALWADRWESAARRGEAKVVRIGDEPGSAANDGAAAAGDGAAAAPEGVAGLFDRERLREAIASAAQEAAAPLWLVLIGHGTFDGRETKFNLRGPDFTPADLAQWLAPLKRPTAIVDCSSASGPFLSALAGPGRVVVTATRSGHEQNFAHLGDALSTAIGDIAADLDKDGQTSLLEAYIYASRRTDEFYAQAGRLATEHALLDDNGDGLGTPAAWFQGVRATRRAKDGAAPDGPLAHAWRLVPGEAERQLSSEALRRRDELEQAIARLRESKASQGADEYYAQLEKLLLEMTRLYEPSP
jgi:hypothetical protein